MSNGRPYKRRAKRKPARPSSAALGLAVRLTAARLGCTCDEVDLGHLRHGEVSSLSVRHDEHCPAADAGSVLVAIVTPGRAA